jgi:hypothetical protein
MIRTYVMRDDLDLNKLQIVMHIQSVIVELNSSHALSIINQAIHLGDSSLP